MCDDLINPSCPVPGNGMNITISIDLGNFMNPCMPQMQAPPPPSTSLTKMPCPPPPMDEGKTVCFLDSECEKGFKGAKNNLFSKLGEKDVDKSQKHPSDKYEKDECEEE